MSSLSQATLGVQCSNSRALSMATLGVFCLPARGGRGIKETKELRRKRRILHVKKTPDLDVQLLPKELKPLTKEVLTTGKADVNGTEVRVGKTPTAPAPSISASAPALESIKDDLDREIAELIRVQEQRAFVEEVKKFQMDVLRFEEEFLVFLILMMDE